MEKEGFERKAREGEWRQALQKTRSAAVAATTAAARAVIKDHIELASIVAESAARRMIGRYVRTEVDGGVPCVTRVEWAFKLGELLSSLKMDKRAHDQTRIHSVVVTELERHLQHASIHAGIQKPYRLVDIVRDFDRAVRGERRVAPVTWDHSWQIRDHFWGVLDGQALRGADVELDDSTAMGWILFALSALSDAPSDAHLHHAIASRQCRALAEREHDDGFLLGQSLGRFLRRVTRLYKDQLPGERAARRKRAREVEWRNDGAVDDRLLTIAILAFRQLGHPIPEALVEWRRLKEAGGKFVFIESGSLPTSRSGVRRRRRMRGRGRTGPARKYDPEQSKRDIADWRASGLSKKKFEEIRGWPKGAIQDAQDRLRSEERRRRDRQDQ